jgi:hypothetical protein
MQHTMQVLNTGNYHANSARGLWVAAIVKAANQGLTVNQFCMQAAVNPPQAPKFGAWPNPLTYANWWVNWAQRTGHIRLHRKL